jgi:UPF0755 protein
LPVWAKRSRKAAIVLLPLLMLGVLVLMAVQGGERWLEGMLAPVDAGTAAEVVFEVPVGASTRMVGESLFAERLISDPALFRYYARYVGLDGALKPGEFMLSTTMSLPQILEILTKGDVLVYRFTVPEGLSVVETADLLAGRGLVSKERFLALAADYDPVATYLPDGVELEYPLEGYLFPATYEHARQVTEDEILSMMFRRFEQVWTEELKARAAELEMSIHEVMTLASIIEKEAQAADERDVIAGVYQNRLGIGMKLDADPTIRYALKKPPEEIVLYVDLEVDSPYNTYRRNGLPPGPIAAPGEAAIRAALYPAEHDYWFFVAKADGTGEHYFSTTLAEQTANIERSRASEKR